MGRAIARPYSGEKGNVTRTTNRHDFLPGKMSLEQYRQREIEMAWKKEKFESLCFVKLVDYDMLYGHRNDCDGKALEEVDRWLPTFIGNM